MQFVHWNAKRNVSSVIRHVFVLVRTWFDVAVIWTCPVETAYVFTRPVWIYNAAAGRRRQLLLWRTFAGAIRHHRRLVLALDARQTVLGRAALEAVARTSATVAVVENVLVVARLASYRRHSVTRVEARQTVERTLYNNNNRGVSTNMTVLFLLKTFYSQPFIRVGSSNIPWAITFVTL